VTQDDGTLSITVTDPLLEEQVKLNPDLLVLSPAIVSRENEELSRLLKLPLDPGRFLS